MCLYPRMIKNKRYLPNKKNGFNPPKCSDKRKEYVPIGCGICLQCRKQKANDWRLRLLEEFKSNSDSAFMGTLTFSNESFDKIEEEQGLKEANAVATFAIKRFIDLVRKKTTLEEGYTSRPTYFAITELGQQSTERMHLHCILWTPFIDIVKKAWKYGNVVFKPTNNGSIKYLLKYLTKEDEKHKDYIPRIFASRGLGLSMKDSIQVKMCKYNGAETKEYIIGRDGRKYRMPIYIRNTIYTEEQRENLWTFKLDQDIRYVLGTRIENYSTEQGSLNFEKALEAAQKLNERLGYPNGYTDEWKRKSYNVRNNELQALQRKLKKKGFEENEIKHIINCHNVNKRLHKKS